MSALPALFGLFFFELHSANGGWGWNARLLSFATGDLCGFARLLPAERAAAARVILEGIEDASADTVKGLEERRAELQRERARVQKDLKNENRKRKRLLSKARGLSVDDLLTVVTMKATAKAKAKAKAKAHA